MGIFFLPPYRVNLGAQLIGCFVNLVLYTLALAASWKYFHSDRRKQDRKVFVGTVIHNLVMDTIGTLAICADTFTVFVVCWGNIGRVMSRNPWALVVWLLTNALTEAVVQSFMVYRYWKLTSNYYVSIPIVVMILFTLAVFLNLCAQSATNIDPHRLLRLPHIAMALGAAVATNLSINVALISYLHQVRTPYIATRHIIEKSITLVTITGCATSLIIVAVILTVFIHPLSSVSTAFGFIVGRTYTLTLLYMLLNRDMMSRDPWLHVIFDTQLTPSLTSQTTSISSPTLQDRTRTSSDVMVFAPPQDSISLGQRGRD
ncbi:hypothetical protein GALMADRAFT_238210 [Galerina marginata CBS 339.88]|uniref:DUF6534 domain-containing protein n=1 Tax=Galerina marginata (strain CBS 339.88) TaxID=685588 RepID=A0A067THS4_GALM3|nr:hypothetical protein GALMADRAFT_238210 [Galerina marginata CBS 339.88]